MNKVDLISPLLHAAAAAEVCELIRALNPGDLTGCELAGMLAILRGAMARTCPGDSGRTAPVLAFVQRPSGNGGTG